MDKFAVIKTGGKQYLVKEGDVIEVETLEAASGDKVEFNEVLLVSNGKDVKLGAPLVDGAVVKGVLKDEVKGEKIKGFKFKAKSRYRKLYGHRQSYSQVEIKEIK